MPRRSLLSLSLIEGGCRAAVKQAVILHPLVILDPLGIGVGLQMAVRLPRASV